MLKPKKIPMRMCVACREMKPKRELIRVVKPPEGGEVAFDPVGKAPGRGAYICRNQVCLLKARKIRALERMLETQISPEVFEHLAAEMPAPEPEDA